MLPQSTDQGRSQIRPNLAINLPLPQPRHRPIEQLLHICRRHPRHHCQNLGKIRVFRLYLFRIPVLVLLGQILEKGGRVHGIEDRKRISMTNKQHGCAR